MQTLRRVAVIIAVAAALVATAGVRVAHAQPPRCTGNGVVQTAPYSCTVTKTIDALTFTVRLDLDENGRAVVTFTMSPVQTVDVPIAVRSYTGIGGKPMQSASGVIPAGQTTAQLVIATVECGQLDMKAVHVKPGVAAGRLAGPVVSWGNSCQPAPATTIPPTTAPASVPTTVTPPEATVIAAVPVTTAGQLPTTGGAVPVLWVVPVLGVAVLLLLVSRTTPRTP